ncbi:Common central domain of tyrosinase [Aphelenchoides besseyi]|nr:Common central domain of tyrosinase [Aphelenchoides besseyi]
MEQVMDCHSTSFAFWALIICLPLSYSQQDCADAPTASLRMVCEQLHKWDTNARAQMPAQNRLVLPPGITSLSGMAADLTPIARTAFQCMDLGCLCNYMGGLFLQTTFEINRRLGSGVDGVNRCTLADGQPLRRAVRKEYRTLTDDERERYHNAVRQIKANGEYDRLARIHSQFAESGGAHSGPAFMIWHREFTKREVTDSRLRYEKLIQRLPFHILDNNLPRPTDSILWTNEFMGATDSAGNLINGPFAPWRTLSGRANIVRRVGAQGSLFRESEVAFAVRQTQVEQVLAFTAPRRGCPIRTNWNVLEYTHGNVHIYVGGDMLDQSTSANDPIFFHSSQFC